MHLCQNTFNANALLLQWHAANATWPFATAASAAGALFLAGPVVYSHSCARSTCRRTRTLGQTVEDS